MALAGACALTGLLIAGYSLFTAKGTSTLIVPPDAVAVVNGQPIARSDFLNELQTQGIDPQNASRAQRQTALDQLIRQELFVQRAKEIDVASYDPDVRTAMVNSVEEEAAANALTTKPREELLRQYYDAHKASYSSEGVMTARVLIFPPAKAGAALRALRAGAGDDQVLRAYSGRMGSKTDGEEFYFAAKIHLGDRLFNVAAKLPNGGVSNPIAMADGTYIVHISSNQPPVAMSFEDARPRVLNDAAAESIKTAGERQNRFLHRRANILIADDMK
jgi:parvulin-like peptidyl-prolyl isomerase